jgi:hypothetical protein
MAKKVVRDIKIEVRDNSDVANEWQDISDHVQQVEYDFTCGEIALCRLTIQTDPSTLRVSKLPM